MSATRTSVGYANDYVGRQSRRLWEIRRTCANGRCTYALARYVTRPPGARELLVISARLVEESDGWHASFPQVRYPCGETPEGKTTYWMESFSMVLRFTEGGRGAEANERTYSEAPACGYGTATKSWLASLAPGLSFAPPEHDKVVWIASKNS